jgi:hypothetical protein
VTGPAWLRHQAGRHRGPAAKETTLQPSLAASLPQPPSPLGAYPGVRQAPAEPPEPDRIVECGFCHVSALSSQMASIGGGQYRCARADGDDCVRRYVRWRETGAKSAPLLSSAELVAAVPAPPLEPLPAGPEPASSTSLTGTNAEDVPDSRRSEGGPTEGVVAEPEPQADAEADAAQFKATERLARWAPGETLGEDEESAEAAAEPPAGTTEPAPPAAEDETPHSPAPEHTEEGDE